MARSIRTVRAVKTTTVPQGLVLYRGPSLLTGEPIVVIVTGFKTASDNPKTGNLLQVWILPDNGTDPVRDAKHHGARSVCGNCPLAPQQQEDGTYKLGPCYVGIHFAPLGVWSADQRRAYPVYDRRKHAALFAGRLLRFGAYGDPGAVPFASLAKVARLVRGWSGYSHQWRTCDQRLRRLCMASVQTEAEQQDAVALGWRTFRVRLESDALLPGEFMCPASAEAGKRLTCAECRACSGAKDGGKNANPAIVFHGSSVGGAWKLKTFERVVAALRAAEEAEIQGKRLALPLA